MYIYSVNGDGSKTAQKSLKSDVTRFALDVDINGYMRLI